MAISVPQRSNALASGVPRNADLLRPLTGSPSARRGRGRSLRPSGGHPGDSINAPAIAASPAAGAAGDRIRPVQRRRFLGALFQALVSSSSAARSVQSTCSTLPGSGNCWVPCGGRRFADGKRHVTARPPPDAAAPGNPPPNAIYSNRSLPSFPGIRCPWPTSVALRSKARRVPGTRTGLAPFLSRPGRCVCPCPRLPTAPTETRTVAQRHKTRAPRSPQLCVPSQLSPCPYAVSSSSLAHAPPYDSCPAPGVAKPLSSRARWRGVQQAVGFGRDICRPPGAAHRA